MLVAFFLRQQCLHEHASVLLYTYVASLISWVERSRFYGCKLILPRLNIQKLAFQPHGVYDSWIEQGLFLAAALTDGFAGLSSCGAAFRWTKS